MIKNLLSLLLLLCCFNLLTAQSYSDDFESYTVGSYIGQSAAEFSTWSGTTGTSEDAKIVDTKAKSGKNSIYFYSTAQGPQDVVLLFGDKYETGIFNLKFSIFVTEGASAYWNFQQELTIGTTWAGNAYYRNDNTLSLDAADKTLASPFKAGKWNDVEYNIDLDNNEWIIKINDVCVGTMLAPAAVASLDIFPLVQGTATSEFWIDDVSFNYEATGPTKNLDVVLTEGGIDGAPFAGESKNISILATNQGSELVEDIELKLTVNASSQQSKTFNDLGLAPGESVLLEIENALTIKQGENLLDFSVVSINGFGSDDVPCNNNLISSINGVTLNPDKRVVVEEATGTWCPWCVRGTVFMEAMEEKYQEKFVGIAVHNGDPMTITEYDNWIGSFPGFSGYPNAVVERSAVMDPSAIETMVINRLQEPVNEVFNTSAVYDEELNELMVSVDVIAYNNLASNKRLVVVLVEDEVTGTGSGYAQANAYAGNTNGPMGGYENLPSPVPASQMVYDIVARALLTPANGMQLGETIAAGETKTFTFGTTLPDEVETEHLKIVAFIVNTGPNPSVDNANERTFSEAIVANNKDINQVDVEVEAFPNPTSDITNIKLDLGEASDVTVSLYSITGQLISSKDFGRLAGEQIFPIDAGNLENGSYQVVLTINGHKVNKRIIVSH